MLTKDRIGGALAIAAAIIGLWLVFQFPEEEEGGDDEGGPTSPLTSEVGEAPAGQVPPPVPGQVQQPGAPAQPQPDDDGDDDD